jgi:hypothetical protein
MEAGDRPGIPAFQYLLTGLETGVLAVIAMLTWLGFSAIWYRHTFWLAPNLLAAAFYGDSALQNRFTIHTFCGLGLYIVIYGALGILFGLAVRDRQASLRITCVAVLCGLGWYFLAFGWIWKRWNPLLAVYTHDRPMFAGHVLYGWILGRYPRILPRARLTAEGPPALAMAPLANPGPASGNLEIKD